MVNEPQYNSFSEFRKEFIENFISPKTNVLEIGPFARSILNPSSCNLKVLDYYNTDELKDQAVKIGLNPDDVLYVDYVCKDDNFENAIQDSFDVVLAAHVLEHVVDIILWFKNIRKIIKDNGYLLVVLPDKKYSFDRFRADTKLSDLIFQYFNPNIPWKNLKSLESHMYYDCGYIKQTNDPVHRLNIEKIYNSLYEWQPGIHSHVFQFEYCIKTVFKPLCAIGLIDFEIVDTRSSSQFGEFSICFKARHPSTNLEALSDFYEIDVTP